MKQKEGGAYAIRGPIAGLRPKSFIVTDGSIFGNVGLYRPNNQQEKENHALYK
jgi:hypothetical protein